MMIDLALLVPVDMPYPPMNVVWKNAVTALFRSWSVLWYFTSILVTLRLRIWDSRSTVDAHFCSVEVDNLCWPFGCASVLRPLSPVWLRNVNLALLPPSVSIGTLTSSQVVSGGGQTGVFSAPLPS
ncbi:unnamed protein product [Protopolystoma xenopodis]|uniref:Uncharacterized protein n=1 Tax=Protopolystoma xenopodis TaxID=117903 RepID=A0A3S5BTR5_9PLAT|nr:unnamed protein product [Protopolystoma xenopodis]